MGCWPLSHSTWMLCLCPVYKFNIRSLVNIRTDTVCRHMLLQNLVTESERSKRTWILAKLCCISNVMNYANYGKMEWNIRLFCLCWNKCKFFVMVIQPVNLHTFKKKLVWSNLSHFTCVIILHVIQYEECFLMSLNFVTVFREQVKFIVTERWEKKRPCEM